MAFVYDYAAYRKNVNDPERPGGAGASENILNGTAEPLKSPSEQKSNFWELSQVSTPKKGDWFDDKRIRAPNPTTKKIDYTYYYDASSGEGQYVYISEDGIYDGHPVSSALLFQSPTHAHMHMGTLHTARSRRTQLRSL